MGIVAVKVGGSCGGCWKRCVMGVRLVAGSLWGGVYELDLRILNLVGLGVLWV